MKRVLLLIDSLGSGGAQRQMAGLAKLLRDKGYAVKILYYHPDNFYKPWLDEHRIGIECADGADNKWKRIYVLYHSVKQYNPDVVISYLDTPNIIACILNFFGLKFKLIASERNITPRLNLRERLKFLLLRKADAIVANSFTQECFIERHYPGLLKKTTVITNFVDTETFVPNGMLVQTSQKDVMKILCIGRITDQKNVLTFLDALYLLKNKGYGFHIDWLGSQMDGAYYTQCVEKVNNLSLSDIFSFRNPTDNIVREYQKADVFCLPSIYEGFPNVICEAMSCGLPVLCSDVCDNPRIVRDHVNGLLFNPNDVNDIVTKFESFFNIPLEEKQLMGRESRNFAVHDFSKISFIEKYEQIIQ